MFYVSVYSITVDFVFLLVLLFRMDLGILLCFSGAGSKDRERKMD